MLHQTVLLLHTVCFIGKGCWQLKPFDFITITPTQRYMGKSPTKLKHKGVNTEAGMDRQKKCR